MRVGRPFGIPPRATCPKRTDREAILRASGSGSPESVANRHLARDWGGLVADGRDLARRHRRPWAEELLEMSDVVRLDHEIRRVLRERQPIAVDLDVLRFAVEERFRSPFAVRAIVRRVRLLDVEEHPEASPSRGAPPRERPQLHWVVRLQGY